MKGIGPPPVHRERVRPRSVCLDIREGKHPVLDPGGRGPDQPRKGVVHMDMSVILAQNGGGAGTILWVIAAVLVIAGIVALVRGSMLAGIVLIVLGLLVGPGGVSIFG